MENKMHCVGGSLGTVLNSQPSVVMPCMQLSCWSVFGMFWCLMGAKRYASKTKYVGGNTSAGGLLRIIPIYGITVP